MSFQWRLILGCSLLLLLSIGGLIVLTSRWATERTEEDMVYRVRHTEEVIRKIHVLSAEARAKRFETMSREPRFRALAAVMQMEDAAATLEEQVEAISLETNGWAAFAFLDREENVVAWKGTGEEAVGKSLPAILELSPFPSVVRIEDRLFEVFTVELTVPGEATPTGHLLVSLPVTETLVEEYSVAAGVPVELVLSYGPARRDLSALETKVADVLLKGGLRMRARIDTSHVAAPLRAMLRKMALVGTFIVILGSLLASVAARGLSLPLRKLAEAARRVVPGKTTEPVRVEGAPEVQILARNFNEMVTSLVKMNQELGSRVIERTRALSREMEERQQVEVQLRHAQKMEAVGQLAAGIAHEINTPIQYVGDNIRFLEESFVSCKKALRAYESAIESRVSIDPDVRETLSKTLEDEDMEYLVEEVPRAIAQCHEGVGHVSNIVRAMKDFSHPGCVTKSLIDLNRSVETAATISKNEWKYVATVDWDLDPALPQASCFAAEMNQVLLNLIVNAAHAIGERPEAAQGGKGRITIATRGLGDRVEIRITDTGMGIKEEVRPRIFEPFYTTKEVGKGTGQGLALAHSVIVKKHGGTLRFETEVGRGTSFIIQIPATAEGALVA